MPVDFLTDAQAARYGRYNEDPNPVQLARYFYLDDADRVLIMRCRDEHTQLGMALQICAEQVLQRLPEDWAWVAQTCERAVCHGDLHMANALCRADPPHGEALLIDYHPTSMPWAYD